MSTSNLQLPTPKEVGVVLWAVCALSLPASPAEACSCAPVQQACEAAWQATSVFIGEVERIETSEKGKNLPFFRSRLVTFRVSEHFRGPGGAVVRVLTGSGGGDCGYRFETGRQYLVYATEDRDGRLRTSVCTRTRPLDRAGEDVAYARAAFQRKEPLGQISGSLFRRTVDLMRDRTRDRPAAGAAILLTAGSIGHRVVVDDRGRFLIHGLPGGKYFVDVEVSGGEYFTAHPEVVELVDSRACASVEAFVMPDGRITGRTVDSAHRPLPGLTVELAVHFRIDGPHARGPIRAVTDLDGRFELTRVPAGEYVIGVNLARDRDGNLLQPRVFFPGQESVGAATRVKVAAGERRTLPDFVLPSALHYLPITGIVLAPDGGPAQGARVFLKIADENGYVIGEPVATDASGRFAASALAGHEYAVFAERPIPEAGSGRVESSDAITVTVAGPPPTPLTLTLRRRY